MKSITQGAKRYRREKRLGQCCTRSARGERAKKRVGTREIYGTKREDFHRKLKHRGRERT